MEKKLMRIDPEELKRGDLFMFSDPSFDVWRFEKLLHTPGALEIYYIHPKGIEKGAYHSRVEIYEKVFLLKIEQDGSNKTN